MGLRSVSWLLTSINNILPVFRLVINMFTVTHNNSTIPSRRGFLSQPKVKSHFFKGLKRSERKSPREIVFRFSLQIFESSGSSLDHYFLCH